jgi:ascorbate PTS system EIIA or EIIAB component
MMCLACKDKESHISKIQAIATKLMEDNAIEKILACQNEEELFKFFN